MNHLDNLESVDVIDSNFISQSPQGMVSTRPETIKVDSLFGLDKSANLLSKEYPKHYSAIEGIDAVAQDHSKGVRAPSTYKQGITTTALTT